MNEIDAENIAETREKNGRIITGLEKDTQVQRTFYGKCRGNRYRNGMGAEAAE